jgi:hypothetical protein
MANVRKYAPGVFVSLGIAIAGSWWLTRPGAYVRGEDVAEALGRVSESQAVAYCLGADSPAWPSNTVTVYTSWDAVYTGFLVAGRNLATNAHASVLWLDATMPAPTNGQTVATCLPAWEAYSVTTNTWPGATNPPAPRVRYEWRLLDTVTNAADGLAATSTRQLPAAGVEPFPPDTALTNLPLCALVYGDATVGQPGRLTPAWTHGNWWTRAGLGIHPYLYACEAVAPLRAAFAIEAGTGYTLATNTAQFGYFDWQTPAYAVLDRDASAGIRAVAVSVSSYGYDDGWFVAADAPVSAEPCETYNQGTFDLRRFFVGSGTLSFEVFPYPATFGQTRTIYFTGERCTVSPASVTWRTLYSKRTINVTIPFGAGVVRMTETNRPTGYVAVINTNAVSPWTLTPVARSGEGSVAVGLVAQPSGPVLLLDQYLRKSTLNQGAAVLTNLTRTVWVGDASALSPSAVTNYSGGYYLQWTTNDAPSQPGWLINAFEASGYAAIAEGSAATAAWDGTLVDASCSLSRWDVGTFLDYPEPQWDATMTFDAQYDSTVAYGCTLPYPSTYACASGYVARVAVYVLAAPRVVTAAPTAVNLATFGDYPVLEVDGAVSDFDAYNDLTFGAVSYLCPVPALPAAPVQTITRQDTAAETSPWPLSARLSLVGEWTAPTAPPTFDLGVRVPQIPADAARTHHWKARDESGFGDHQEMWQRTFRHGVKVRRFVVVVDWAFKHLDTANPFAPSLYTPEWCATNTP